MDNIQFEEIMRKRKSVAQAPSNENLQTGGPVSGGPVSGGPVSGGGLDQDTFNKLMASRGVSPVPSNPAPISDVENSSGVMGRTLDVMGETAKGIGRAGVSLATVATPAGRAAWGVDLAGNIMNAAGSKLSSAVTGEDYNALYQRRNEALNNPQTLAEKTNPLSVIRRGLNTVNSLKDTPLLKKSADANKSLSEGIKDIDWWAANVPEAATFSLGLAKSSLNEVMKRGGTKYAEILKSPTATEAIKKSADAGFKKLLSKTFIKNSVLAGGGMSHMEYTEYQKKHPEDATALGDAFSTTMGAGAGVIDGLSMNMMASMPFIKKFGKDAGMKAATSFWKEVAKELPKNAVTEGGTEYVQTIIENVGVKYGYDKDRGLMDGTKEAAFIGGIVGGGFAAAGAHQQTSGVNEHESALIRANNLLAASRKLKDSLSGKTEELNKYEIGSKEYDRLQKEVNKGNELISKYESEVDAIYKEFAPPKIDSTPVVNTLVSDINGNPVSVDEVIAKVNNREITRDQWNGSGSGGYYTHQEKADINKAFDDVSNADTIDMMAEGNYTSDTTPVSGVVPTVDGTGNRKVLFADYTDDDAISALNEDMVSMFGEGGHVPMVASKVNDDDVDFINTVSDVFGVRVVPIEATDGNNLFNGMDSQRDDRLIYINTKSDKPVAWIFGHEFSHSLERSNPDAYKILLEEADKYINKDKIGEYGDAIDSTLSEHTGKPVVPMSTKAISKEMLGDFVGDRFATPEFWNKLHEDNPSKFKQLIDSVREYISMIIDKLKGENVKESDKFYKDIISLEKTLVSVVNQHIGYTGAAERLTASKIKTGKPVDINEDNNHLTTMTLGDTGLITFREDQEAIRIFGLSRLGARSGNKKRGGIVPDEGVPTAALDELKAYANENGKIVIAETGNNKEYMTKQGFVDKDGSKLMAWRGGKHPMAAFEVDELVRGDSDEIIHNAKLGIKTAEERISFIQKEMERKKDLMIKVGASADALPAYRQYQRNEEHEITKLNSQIRDYRKTIDEHSGRATWAVEPGEVAEPGREIIHHRSNEGVGSSNTIYPDDKKNKAEIEKELDKKRKENQQRKENRQRRRLGLNKDGMWGMIADYGDNSLPSYVSVKNKQLELSKKYGEDPTSQQLLDIIRANPRAYHLLDPEATENADERVKRRALIVMKKSGKSFSTQEKVDDALLISHEAYFTARKMFSTMLLQTINKLGGAKREKALLGMKNREKGVRHRQKVRREGMAAKLIEAAENKLASKPISEIESELMERVRPGEVTDRIKADIDAGFIRAYRIFLRDNSKRNRTLRRQGYVNFESGNFTAADHIQIASKIYENILAKHRSDTDVNTDLNPMSAREEAEKTARKSRKDIKSAARAETKRHTELSSLSDDERHEIGLQELRDRQDKENKETATATATAVMKIKKRDEFIDNATKTGAVSRATAAAMFDEQNRKPTNEELGTAAFEDLGAGVIEDYNNMQDFNGEVKESQRMHHSVNTNKAFVSNTAKQVDKLKLDVQFPNEDTADGWKTTLGQLARKGKLNPEELAFSYINEYLDGKTGKITREDVIKYLNDSAPRVTTEPTDGVYPEEYIDGLEEADNIYNNHMSRLDESSKSEHELKQEASELRDEYSYEHFNVPYGALKWEADEETNRYYSYRDKLTLSGVYSNYGHKLIYYSTKDGTYRGSGYGHFGKNNVLVSLRYDTRHLAGSDETVLFIREAQSDWHNDAIKEGYQKSVSHKEYIDSISAKLKNSISNIVDQNDEVGPAVDGAVNFLKTVMSNKLDYSLSNSMRDVIKRTHNKTKFDLKLILKLYTDSHEFSKAYNHIIDSIRSKSITNDTIMTGIPAAPYKKTWPLIAFKHAMIEAYNRSNNWVAWPSTGKQVAEIENWVDVKYDAVIDNYTRSMPSKIGEFIKEYGGKVEKVSLDSGQEVFAVKITPQMKEMMDGNQVTRFSINTKSDGITGKDTIDPNPEAQQEIYASHEVKPLPWYESLKNWTMANISAFTTHVVGYKPGEDGFFKDMVRRAKGVDKFAAREAFSRIYKVVGKLTKEERRVFEMNILLNDIISDTRPGKNGYAAIKDGSVPFYGTIAKARISMRHFREAAQKSPAVMNAIATRRKEMVKLHAELVKLGYIDKRDKREISEYFHHQNLERMDNGYDYLFKVHKRAGDVKFNTMNERNVASGEYITNYIVSEYKMLTDAIATIELYNIKKELRKRYDITEKLVREGGLTPFPEVPEGYSKWNPSEFSGWGSSPSFPESVIAAILNDPSIHIGRKNLLADEFKGGNAWIIPDKMKNAMMTVREETNDPILQKTVSKIVNSWRLWTLLNPMKSVMYNVNNMVGDASIVLTHPEIFKYVPQAIKDLAGDVRSSGLRLPFNLQRYGSYLTDEAKKELEEAHRYEAIGAGFMMHEIYNIENEFQMLMSGVDGNPMSNKAMAYWQGAKDVTNFRENIFRLAAFRYFKDRINSGDPHVYGASNPAEIDDIKDVTQKAAKLSRELLGDYGRISHSGQYVRKYIMPFYSWVEINAPRYVRLMRNVKHEGVGSAAGVAANLTWKASIMGAKMAGFAVLVSLFNGAFFGDEEDELTEKQKRKMHLILGRREDGSIRYLPITDAFTDALSWFGADDITDDYNDIVTGKTTVSDKLVEMGKAPFIKAMSGSIPFKKAAVALATKTTTNIHGEVVPIRDRGEYISKLFSMDILYRAAAGLPTKGVAEEWQSKLAWSVNPGEAAYYNIKEKVNDFNRKNVPHYKDMESSGGSPSNKSNALYYYKQAIKMRDFVTAGEYLKSYLNMGGDVKGLKSSYAGSMPTAGLNRKHRGAFYKSLSEKDKKQLNAASKWYKETYKTFGTATP